MLYSFWDRVKNVVYAVGDDVKSFKNTALEGLLYLVCMHTSSF